MSSCFAIAGDMIAGRAEKRFREQDDVPEAVKRLKLEGISVNPSYA